MTELEPFAQAAALTLSSDDQLSYASARIRRYCRWHIYPQIAETKTIDAAGGRTLFLPTLFLASVESVTLVEDETVVDPATYDASELGMIELRNGCWPTRFASVTVAFTHGYEELPAELAEVAISVAKRMPAQQASVAQEAAGGVSRVYGGLLSGQAALSAGWTYAEEQVLQEFRLKARP